MTQDKRTHPAGSKAAQAASTKLARGLPSTEAIRVSLLYVTLFLVVGISLPFFPVFLEGRGLDAATIALVLAVPQVLRVIVTPAMGFAADRAANHRLWLFGLGLGCAGAAIALVVLPFGSTVWLFALSALLAVLVHSAMPLSETVAIAATRRGENYGRMRLWGSLAFIAATLIGGPAIAAFGADAVVVLMAVCGVALALSAWVLPDERECHSVGPTEIVSARSVESAEIQALEPPPGGMRFTEPDAGQTQSTWPPNEAAPKGAEHRAPRVSWSDVTLLLRQRWFVLVVATGAALQATHAVYYVFGSLHWEKTGVSYPVISLLWSLGVLAEVVLFAYATAVGRRLGATGLLILAAVAGLIRWPLTAVDPPLVMLAAVQLLHAFTFGAAHLGVIQLLAERVPARLTGTAQAVYATISGGIVMGLALWLAGPLYEAWDGGAYHAMAVLAAFALLGALALRWTLGKASNL